MVRVSLFVTYLFFLLCTQQIPASTEWRGLEPLKSTRLDVERTLGPPNEKLDDQHLTYYFPDAVVFFEFSSNPKCHQKLPYTSWDVPPETLTGINIRLRRQPLVEETTIDLTKLKKIKGEPDLIGHYYYSTPDDGFTIEVGGKNYVMGYLYNPGSKYKDLLCEPANER